MLPSSGRPVTNVAEPGQFSDHPRPRNQMGKLEKKKLLERLLGLGGSSILEGRKGMVSSRLEGSSITFCRTCVKVRSIPRFRTVVIWRSGGEDEVGHSLLFLSLICGSV